MSEWLWPVQKLVNDALEYDLNASEKLQALAGKTLVLEVSEPSAAISVTVESNGFIFLQTGSVSPCDAQVAGKAKDLFNLFFYVDDVIESEANLEALTTPTFFAPNVSMFNQRLGKGDDAVMLSTVGSYGNHAHANGISIELFANNYVLGPGRFNKYSTDKAGYLNVFFTKQKIFKK